MPPALRPSIRSRPLCEVATETVVRAQTRTSPPRSRRRTAVLSPADTHDPLITGAPPAARVTEPFTLASEEKSCPTGACANAAEESARSRTSLRIGFHVTSADGVQPAHKHHRDSRSARCLAQEVPQRLKPVDS